jgi:hypothetical protein
MSRKGTKEVTIKMKGGGGSRSYLLRNLSLGTIRIGIRNYHLDRPIPKYDDSFNEF